LTQPLTVKLDPRSTATSLDLTKQFQLSRSCASGIAKAEAALRGVQSVQPQLEQRRNGVNAAIGGKVSELVYDAEKLAGTGGPRGSAEITLPEVVTRLSTVLGVAQGADRAPTAAAYALFESTNRELTRLLAGWKRLQDDLPALNELLQSSKITPVAVK
jgi:hypothetical protein